MSGLRPVQGGVEWRFCFCSGFGIAGVQERFLSYQCRYRLNETDRQTDRHIICKIPSFIVNCIKAAVQ